MVYCAHKTEDGKMQSIREHLDNVAELAEANAIDMVKPLAFAAGKAHDIGKYADLFQRRLNGENVRYEHSICGAAEYAESDYAKSKSTMIAAYILEYCIAGHHTGLPDGGTANDEGVTLRGRLAHGKDYCGEMDYDAYKDEIELPFPMCQELMSVITEDRFDCVERFAFFTRYVFSCLTDADFLDTEKFCRPEANRNLKADFAAVKAALDKKMNSFVPVTELQKARSRLQEQAYKNAKQSGNISILNIPTGSGKTLCSLKIAVDKLIASNGNLKRIIYVIPYTSIIEQTAEIFEAIFGEYADILQHYSNYSFDDDTKEPSTMEKLKRASENWDAPVVITTSVQFFESIYHYKGSSLRKFHNMANSIIVLDEVHLLPVKYLQPCLRAIGYITKYLNSHAVFLSATMPDYDGFIKKFMSDCSYTELVREKKDFASFKKCRYINLGRMEFEGILEKARNYQSSLIVVNKRKTARELYQSIDGIKYHLSTYMTPADRLGTIAEIRKNLSGGRKITVVSTSLIEAGVDLDFKAVFREIAGLDNIVQSGGRCNREGKDASGDVYVFDLGEEPVRELQVPVNIVNSLMEEYGDITSAECVKEYYYRLFEQKKDVIENNSIDDGYTQINNTPFRTYADRFEFISEETTGIVIADTEEAIELYNRLREHDYSVKRKLQKYTVPLKRYEMEQALKLGIIDDFGTGVYLLSNSDYYRKETGLDLDVSCDWIV